MAEIQIDKQGEKEMSPYDQEGFKQAGWDCCKNLLDLCLRSSMISHVPATPYIPHMPGAPEVLTCICIATHMGPH